MDFVKVRKCVCVFFLFMLYLHCMLHYYVALLRAWLLHFFPVLYFPIMVLWYSYLLSYSIYILQLITLFFIQHYIVRKSFKIIVVF